MITLENTFTEQEVNNLVLLLSRMSFDDFLRLTDGGNNTDQAYSFSMAASMIRNKLLEAAETAQEHSNARG